MNHFAVLALGLLGAVLAPASARAELTFEKPVQEFHRMPEDGSVEARFAFKNTGKTQVEIRRIRTSCGCTTARLEKKTYAPGESGEIVTKFVFGSRKGGQRKIVTVTSGDKEEWKLDLRCWIGEPIRLSPALVYWKVGEAPAAKEIKIAVPEGQKISVKSVSSPDPKFSAKLETVNAGSTYVILVKPSGTGEKASAELSIQTDYPPDAPKSYRVFARIK